MATTKRSPTSSWTEEVRADEGLDKKITTTYHVIYSLQKLLSGHRSCNIFQFTLLNGGKHK